MPPKRSFQWRSIRAVYEPRRAGRMPSGRVLWSPPSQKGVLSMASNASRYLFLFLIGLAVGIVGTVMAMRAIDARQDHFPHSVMEVQAWHLGQLKAATQQNRCAATDTLPHLQALR